MILGGLHGTCEKVQSVAVQSVRPLTLTCSPYPPCAASGCFLCIRCSGIHRSMGTHISKVKSIDLDIWTPEQMDSIQKWGNKRANLYWEAHLKAGHIPPEHKVESFIRSKYETRRWAKEGQPPSDPSVLEGGAVPAPPPAAAVAPAAAAATSTASSSRSARPPAPAPLPTAIDLLGGDPMPAPATTSVTSPRGSLLDDAPAVRASSNAAPTRTTTAPAPAPAASAKPAAPAASGGGGGLFDLDWHDPPPQSSAPSANSSGRGKSDILSLFGNSSSVRSPPLPTQQAGGAGGGAFGGLDAFSGLSMGSTAPAAARGTRSTSTSSSAAPPAAAAAASNPWAAPVPTATSSGMFGSADVWGGGSTSSPPNKGTTGAMGGGTASGDIWGEFNTSTTTSTSGGGSGGGGGAAKDDPFGDIWK